MKIKQICSLLIFASVLWLTHSCSDELNFEQIDDIVLTPVFEIDFIFSEFDIEDNIPPDIPANEDFTIQPNALRDTINYDLVGTDFAIDNLEKVELTIEARNTIQKTFMIQFQFLTDDNEPLGESYIVPVREGLGEGTDPIISFSNPDPIILDNAILNELSATQKIAVEIIAPTVNTDLRGILVIRSKAAYFVNLEL